MDLTAQERNTILRRLSELAPWHFDHEILPGVMTGSFNRPTYAEPDLTSVALIDPRNMIRFFKQAGGLAGKSVLDVACNSGGYCFLAYTLGATRVLGVEVRQHWLDQAEFVRSVKYPSSTAVEFRTTNIVEYLDSSEERFDITIFKGIFYHLPDPISVLSRLCDRTTEMLLVDTMSSDIVPEDCLTPIKESETHVMSGVNGLAWLPGGPAAVKPILEFKGFKFTEVDNWRHGISPNRGRFGIVASRSPIVK